MLLIVPCGNAGGLHHRAHRAAVVGAVEQKRFDQLRISGHKTASHAGYIAALGETGQGDEVFKVGPAQLGGGLQAAQRRFVPKINLAVALIRGHHKAIAVAQLKQLAPLVQRHHRPRRVSRRAHKNQLGALPHALGHATPIHSKVACRIARHEVGRCTSQKGCALVDLIERVGA